MPEDVIYNRLFPLIGLASSLSNRLYDLFMVDAIAMGVNLAWESLAFRNCHVVIMLDVSNNFNSSNWC